MPNIYVTRAVPSETIVTLKLLGEVRVNPHDRPLTSEELKQNIRGCDAVVSLLTDVIDAEVMDAAGPGLRIVANYAVGYNNLDVAAANRCGIVLTNTPGVLDEATATHTIALMLAVARRIPEADRFARSGHWAGWAPMFFMGLDVDRKTLGIAGLGRIGRAVGMRSQAFGMRIIYADVSRDQAFEQATGAVQVGKDALLRESDFLTLHVPLLPETHRYIGAAELQAIKRTAVLLNASRGPVVDEKALAEALRTGVISGAGLDVFEDEPRIEPGLLDLDNAVLVPHLASATPDTRIAMGRIVAGNIAKVLHGEPPQTCINPEVVRRPV